MGLGLSSLVLGACGAARPAIDGRIQATGAPGRFRLANASAWTVCFVYMSPSNYSGWGPDWLGSRETMMTGVARDFEVNAGTYDIKLETCQREVVFQRFGVEVTDGTEIRFEQSIIERR